jgi:Ribosomal protein L21
MTFAVIHTGGKQYKVAANDTLRLEKLSMEEGQLLILTRFCLQTKMMTLKLDYPF